MANVKVRAIENGHDGMQYRSAGELFEVSKERLKDGSTWFALAGKADQESDPESNPLAE